MLVLLAGCGRRPRVSSSPANAAPNGVHRLGQVGYRGAQRAGGTGTMADVSHGRITPQTPLSHPRRCVVVDACAVLAPARATLPAEVPPTPSWSTSSSSADAGGGDSHGEWAGAGRDVCVGDSARAMTTSLSVNPLSYNHADSLTKSLLC